MSAQQLDKRLYGQKAPVPHHQDELATIIATAEELTSTRYYAKDYHALGVMNLMRQAQLRMKDIERRSLIPSQDGIRRAIQYAADARFFECTPLIHLQGLHPDVDTEATNSAYAPVYRRTSCYVVNWVWELRRGKEGMADIAASFQEALGL